MHRLVMDMAVVRRNLAAIDAVVRGHGASWSLVTKVLSGWPDALDALVAAGVESVADSRLENIRWGQGRRAPAEVWYLRPPCLSELPEVVARTDISLHSDLEVLGALSREALAAGRVHGIVVMAEMGDLREGVPPAHLAGFIRRAAALPGLRLVGIGSNLGCLSGAIPTLDQFAHLALYRELMELKCDVTLPLVSAGTSAVLPLAVKGELPRAVNHFRIGESVFLGTDLVGGGTLPFLADDAIVLEAEVVEVREKSLDQCGEVLDIGPFEHFGAEDQGRARGMRAVVSLGQLDTAIQGLTCLEPGHTLVGASSDLAVVGIEEGFPICRVGDRLRFRPSYGALVHLTASPYGERVLLAPDPEPSYDLDLPPVLGLPPLDGLGQA